MDGKSKEEDEKSKPDRSTEEAAALVTYFMDFFQPASPDDAECYFTTDEIEAFVKRIHSYLTPLSRSVVQELLHAGFTYDNLTGTELSWLAKPSARPFVRPHLLPN